MPEKGSNVQFTGHHKQVKAPFVIYPDFECNLNEVQKTNGTVISIKIILLVVMDIN